MSGINFTPVASDTAKNMNEAVKYILNLNISPDDKIRRLSTTFNLVGSDFYTQMFDANSQVFDSTAIGTTDYNEMSGQIDRLARKIVQNDNLGRNVKKLVNDFYDSALGQAQDRAFRNAISLDKHPTLTRSIVGETCKWCIRMAGTHINPEPEMFARHENCDCLFTVSGYKSRNGILNNYSRSSSSEYEAKIKSIENAFKDITPGVGSLQREGGLQIPKRKTHEAETFRWLKKEVGGNFTILDESRKKGVNMPDGIRNNTEIIEVKSALKKNGIDDGIRQAIKQTSNDNLAETNIKNYERMRKIAVLDGRGSEIIENMSYDEVWEKIERRIIRTINEGEDVSLDYVIIRRNNGDLFYKI